MTIVAIMSLPRTAKMEPKPTDCYPLISEAGGLLMDEAIKQGIETKGKSKFEIAKDIFSSQVQSGRPIGKEVK